MTRPKHYPRARWYASRRNRRGEPTTVVRLDELTSGLCMTCHGAEVWTSDITSGPLFWGVP